MKRLAFLVLFLAGACNRGETAQPAIASGDPERGRQLAAQYGCTFCHLIPGVDGPQGSLGPSLLGVASRPTISFGTVRNTPANLVRFIQSPTSLNPNSSMPLIALAGGDAQDIAAYLMTLR